MDSNQEMLISNLVLLAKVLNKNELNTLGSIYKRDLVDESNMLRTKFIVATPDMSYMQRSIFKKKLIVNCLIIELNGRIMFNPFIFYNDSSYYDDSEEYGYCFSSLYLSGQSYIYILGEDTNMELDTSEITIDELEKFIIDKFGTLPDNRSIYRSINKRTTKNQSR